LRLDFKPVPCRQVFQLNEIDHRYNIFEFAGIARLIYRSFLASRPAAGKGVDFDPWWMIPSYAMNGCQRNGHLP
jgi:hypothetical protein